MKPTITEGSDVDKRGFDLYAWVNSLRSSLKTTVICVLGIFLSWLIFWQVAPAWNRVGAIELYNLVSGNAAIFAVGSIATFGDVIWIPIVFFLYVFRKDRYDWTSSLILAVAAITSQGLTTILKLAFGLPRPFQDPTLGISARFETPTDHGLPSGHTTSAFTVATVVWARYPQWRIPFVTLAIATGICMIILGLHFPSDVIAGTFLGIFSGTFVITLAKLRASNQ